jgi:hypothetical protein
MRIDRVADGIRLRFPRSEGELLVQLFGDTAEALRPGVLDPSDPVLQRLFPSAYPDDAEAEQDFRELTESSLRDERIERAEQCTADVAAAPVRRRELELLLDNEASTRWMRALNDVRLAVGTRLDISEDDELEMDDDRVDPDDADDADDPDSPARAAYVWLTAVQDTLVHALMR